MNKCPKCGKESDSKFCPECGTKMLTDETDVMHQIPDREGKSSSKDIKKASKAEKKAAKKAAEAAKPFYKRKWFIILAVIVGLILISQIAGAMGPKTTAISAEYTGKTMEGTKVSIDDFTVTAKKDDGTSETVEDAELNSDYTLVYGKTTAAKITYDNHSTTVKIVCNQKKPTTGEKNALAKAKEYLSTMPFSYKGLIKQLEFEGFSTQEATYGADNCKADWNEQAAKSAKNYMEISSFSESGLIEQLEFEGYTEEQAEYGAKKAGY